MSNECAPIVAVLCHIAGRGSHARGCYRSGLCNRRELGIPLDGGDLVFSQPDGKPLLSDTVTHAWVKLARRTGLKGIRLHDARHSHASLMLKQGIHPKIVQERLVSRHLNHDTLRVTSFSR
jgi:integrase